MIYHGHLRTTEDVDVVIRRPRISDTDLLAALTSVGARRIGNELDPETGVEKTCPVDLAYVENRHLMMMLTNFLIPQK